MENQITTKTDSFGSPLTGGDSAENQIRISVDVSGQSLSQSRGCSGSEAARVVGILYL